MLWYAIAWFILRLYAIACFSSCVHKALQFVSGCPVFLCELLPLGVGRVSGSVLPLLSFALPLLRIAVYPLTHMPENHFFKRGKVFRQCAGVHVDVNRLNDCTGAFPWKGEDIVDTLMVKQKCFLLFFHFSSSDSKRELH